MKINEHIFKTMLGCLMLLIVPGMLAGHAAGEGRIRPGQDVIFALDN